jgi:hypothetical protein
VDICQVENFEHLPIIAKFLWFNSTVLLDWSSHQSEKNDSKQQMLKGEKGKTQTEPPMSCSKFSLLEP